jgi:serine/threonine protein kinase
MSVQSPSRTPPLSVGRYELIGRAGNGISEVYRARSAAGALVAIYLYPEGADPLRLRARLDAAVEAAAELDHPNVLRVIDGGGEAGYGYLVTEWMDGTTLARMIEIHGRLPEANVIRFAAQIGQAVDHVRRGDRAVCRVDPSNVLVRPDGVAKLIPFELPGEQATAPLLGAMVLKPEFATPAADQPKAKSVPFAELIFSLGTTLHEALTGTAWTPPVSSATGRRRRARSD